jgi:hypothetical protein
MADNSVLITLKVIDDATPELKKLVATIDSSTATIRGKLNALGTAMGAVSVALIGGFAAITKSAINTADEMGMTAQKVGMSVDSFSALAYAAKMNDVPLDGLKTGINQLNKSLIESQNAGSEAANAFKYLGVSTKDSNGKVKSSEQVLNDIANAFKKLPDGASKSAVAMELFGKAGTDLIPMLNAGADGIKTLTDEAHTLGIVITDELASAANEFNDNLDKLGSMASGVGMVIAKEMLPVMNNFVTALGNMIAKSDGVQQFGQGVAQVFKFIIKAGAGVVFVIQSIGKVIGALAAAAVAIFNGDFGQVGGIFSNLKSDLKDSALATADFMQQMDAAPIAKVTDAVKKATAAHKDYKKVVKPDGELEKQKKAYDDLLVQIQREIDGVKQLTFADQIRFEMEKGRYKFLTPEQKQHVEDLLKEADAKRLILDADKQLKDSAENIAKARRDAGAAANLELQNSTQYLQILKTSGKDAADAWLQAQNAIAPLAAQRTLLEDLRDKAKAANDTQGVTRYQDAINALNGVIAQTSSDLQGVASATTNVKNETAAWNDYIGKTRDEVVKLDAAAQMLQLWFTEGKISALEFKNAMEQINTAKFTALKTELTDLQKFTMNAAAGMQSDMSTFFFDAMNGKMDDLGTMFKHTLDKMVADLLASQLTDYLFGATVKSAGGSRAGGALTGLIGSIFGGFRAEGGPVKAGVPYIVGEKRPELFIPSSSGTIAPSVSSAIAGGGANTAVTFNITAMDSQDVMRSMEKIKRPLADLISGTKRAYNT